MSDSTCGSPRPRKSRNNYLIDGALCTLEYPYSEYTHAFECRLRRMSLNKPNESCQHPSCDQLRKILEHECTDEQCNGALSYWVIRHWILCSKKESCRLCRPAQEEWNVWLARLESDQKWISFESYRYKVLVPNIVHTKAWIGAVTTQFFSCEVISDFKALDTGNIIYKSCDKFYKKLKNVIWKNALYYQSSDFLSFF